MAHQLKNATISPIAPTPSLRSARSRRTRSRRRLGDALRKDKAWGVRATAADTLGELGGPTLRSCCSRPPLERQPVGSQPGGPRRLAISKTTRPLPQSSTPLPKRQFVSRSASALLTLGRSKPARPCHARSCRRRDSPDGFLRNAALRAFSTLGDDNHSTPLEWSAPGKPVESRTAAIYSLARLQKETRNHPQIASYLSEPRHPVRMASIYALGTRGDASAIPRLEALLKTDDLSIVMAPMIRAKSRV